MSEEKPEEMSNIEIRIMGFDLIPIQDLEKREEMNEYQEDVMRDWHWMSEEKPEEMSNIVMMYSEIDERGEIQIHKVENIYSSLPNYAHEYDKVAIRWHYADKLETKESFWSKLKNLLKFWES